MDSLGSGQFAYKRLTNRFIQPLKYLSCLFVINSLLIKKKQLEEFNSNTTEKANYQQPTYPIQIEKPNLFSMKEWMFTIVETLNLYLDKYLGSCPQSFVFAIFFLMNSCYAISSLTPSHLRCEYLNAPEGIDILQPRLSWELKGKGRGRDQRQSAYQIIAASTIQLLNNNNTDLWDSKKIISNKTAHIRYAGKELKATQQIFWKVRVWDQNETVSNWSKPAKWSMGLMLDSDWHAKWIGLEGQKDTNFLQDASWICFAKDHDNPSITETERYYRRTINVPNGCEIKRATFLYTGDISVQGWINGRDLGTRNDHRRIKDQDITFRLEPGINVIALKGTIPGKTVGSGGVVGLLKIEFIKGDPIIIPTDHTWKVSDQYLQGWNDKNIDETQWASPKVLGPVGMRPWGNVRIAEDRRLPARWLRREFEVPKKIQHATVYYSGLGWSELYLNGKKVGDHVLSPGLTEYQKRVFYVTFDVTTQLREGRNAIGVILGNGRFYSPRSSVYASMPSYGFPKLMLHLRIEYTDGTTSEIVSDESWKLTTDGPIVANNDYDGEEYDARKELINWSSVGYNDEKWQYAKTVSSPQGKVVAQMIEPIRVTQTIKPISITEPKPGVFVFDLGQNIVGWCKLRVSGNKGTSISLLHGELLKSNGMLELANMRGAQVTDIYILKGENEEIWEPRFTTHGFRYIEVRGFPGKPDLKSLEGRVVNDDLRHTGQFTSSNSLLNQIHQNAIWGIKGNYKSIPMDCPQRDERQGWLGDRIEESRGEAYLFDNAAFYSKWLQDISDGQLENGNLPSVAPSYWPNHTENVVWPSATIFIPNMIHEHYADTQAVSLIYDKGKKWMNFMSSFLAEGIIAKDSYGDWCVPPEHPALIHTNDTNRITSKGVLATTFFYKDAKLMENFAKMLNRTKDADQFKAIAETIKAAFNKRFFNSELGQYDNGTQTSFILPLAFGLVPEQERARVFANLVKNIANLTDNHIGTGLVGGQFLYRVLSDNGSADLAYTIATQQNYPSYGYMISNGATTIWELWNGNTADPWMNSGNHVMLLGDFVVWLYEYLGGIKADPLHPGFKNIIMKPHTVNGLQFVRVNYHSIHGMIKSEWHKQGNKFNWHITIPPNATATVYVPTNNIKKIEERGKNVLKSKGVKFLRTEHNSTVFQINSGKYNFKLKE